MRRSWRRGLAVAMVAILAAGCSDSNGSGGSDDAPPLRVEDIRPAIEALEAQLGGPQQYFEVNATPTLVNLFVATENGTKAVAYVYAAGKLQEPAPPEAASGPTFPASDIDFDEDKVLEPLVKELPNSRLRVFSIVGKEGGGVSYVVTIDSTEGGQLQVPVGPNGEILGAEP